MFTDERSVVRNQLSVGFSQKQTSQFSDVAFRFVLISVNKGRKTNKKLEPPLSGYEFLQSRSCAEFDHVFSSEVCRYQP